MDPKASKQRNRRELLLHVRFQSIILPLHPLQIPNHQVSFMKSAFIEHHIFQSNWMASAGLGNQAFPWAAKVTKPAHDILLADTDYKIGLQLGQTGPH